MHFVDLGESFPTSTYLQNLASIQPRTSLTKFESSSYREFEFKPLKFRTSFLQPSLSWLHVCLCHWAAHSAKLASACFKAGFTILLSCTFTVLLSGKLGHIHILLSYLLQAIHFRNWFAVLQRRGARTVEMLFNGRQSGGFHASEYRNESRRGRASLRSREIVGNSSDLLP